jgi:hypothetical protein
LKINATKEYSMGPQYRSMPIVLDASNILVTFAMAILLLAATVPAITRAQTASDTLNGETTASSPGYADGTPILNQSLAAESAGTPMIDVTLVGAAIMTTSSANGSANTQTGSISMIATAAGQSSTILELPQGSYIELRNYVSVPHTGSYVGPDGVSHSLLSDDLAAVHPAWFFPEFIVGSTLSSTGYASADFGAEQLGNVSVRHVAVFPQRMQPQAPGNQEATNSALSSPPLPPGQNDLYLDPTTLLPVALMYSLRASNADPNVKPMVKKPSYGQVEMRFSNYQQVHGHPVPFHMQMYVQGALVMDIQISSAAFNTGVAIGNTN